MERDNKTTEAYNKIAQEYNQRNYNHFWDNEYTYFKSILSGNKVVDLGCGGGRDGEQFVRDGFDYLGIDASDAMLQIASQRVADGQFRLMDLRDLDLPVESFDGFWASASLLHFSKQEIPDILKSFYNLLRFNGVGFISVKEKKVMDEGWTLVNVPEEQRDETIPVRFKPYLKGLLDGSIKLPPLESSPAESESEQQ